MSFLGRFIELLPLVADAGDQVADLLYAETVLLRAKLIVLAGSVPASIGFTDVALIIDS